VESKDSRGSWNRAIYTYNASGDPADIKFLGEDYTIEGKKEKKKRSRSLSVFIRINLLSIKEMLWYAGFFPILFMRFIRIILYSVSICQKRSLAPYKLQILKQAEKQVM
jgi:hypothetical protein